MFEVPSRLCDHKCINHHIIECAINRINGQQHGDHPRTVQLGSGQCPQYYSLTQSIQPKETFSPRTENWQVISYEAVDYLEGPGQGYDTSVELRIVGLQVHVLLEEIFYG